MLDRISRCFFGWPQRFLRRNVARELKANSRLEAKNIRLQRQRMALISTAEYVDINMSGVAAYSSKLSLIDLAVSSAANRGLFLEFGVYQGQSIRLIAERTKEQVYGFDSFDGLPEYWRDGFEEGKFRVEELPTVPGNVSLVKGLFERSLPDFLRDDEADVAFLHIDCDLYSSTKTIFECLESRIVPGTVILFDEYFNYPGWQYGEYQAFQEFVKTTGLSYEYIGYNFMHEQVALIIV